MKNRYIVIPARGGSKGIKNKNLQIVGGKTLLKRAIDVSLKVPDVAYVLVSSDSDEVLDVARQCGALPHRRQKKFSSDSASSESAIIDGLENGFFCNKTAMIAMVQPTTPFTIPLHIHACFCLSEKYNKPATTVFEAHYCIWKNDKETEFSDKNRHRRQDKEPLLVENGGVYVQRADRWPKGRFFGGPPKFCIVKDYRRFEIDTYLDLEICNMVAKKRCL